MILSELIKILQEQERLCGDRPIFITPGRRLEKNTLIQIEDVEFKPVNGLGFVAILKTPASL